MAGASKTISINAPVEKVYDVISNFERYPEFLPEVKRIRVTDRKGAEFVVHNEIDVIKTIKYSIRVKEERPNRMSWSYVDGEYMKDNSGSWVLEADGPGKTRATYTVDMRLGALVPNSIVKALVETSLPKMLEAFKKRAEST